MERWKRGKMEMLKSAYTKIVLLHKKEELFYVDLFALFFILFFEKLFYLIFYEMNIASPVDGMNSLQVVMSYATDYQYRLRCLP